MKVSKNSIFNVVVCILAFSTSGASPDVSAASDPNRFEAQHDNAGQDNILGSKRNAPLKEFDEEVREHTLKELLNIKQNGYIPISEEEARQYLLDNYSPFFTDPQQVVKNTNFEISQFRKTEILTKRGIIGMNIDKNNQFNAVVHVLTLSEAESITVTLEEIRKARGSKSFRTFSNFE